jgi:hypothetical protein
MDGGRLRHGEQGCTSHHHRMIQTPDSKSRRRQLFADRIRWLGRYFVKRINFETGATSAWNPAGIPDGLPLVYRRSAPSERLNSSRRHRAGLRSSRSPSNSMFFRQHFPWSRMTKSYNSSPAFRAAVWSIVRPRPLQSTNLQESLSHSESFSSPVTENRFLKILKAERSAMTMVPLGV